MPRPQDIQAFIRSHGGMTDPGGDLRSMGLHELIAKPGRGVPQDRMRLMAAEAGYLGADTARAMAETHPNDLLNAVSGDRPVHSVRDGDAAAAWADYDAAKEAHASARGEFGTRSTFGVVPPKAPVTSYSLDDIYGPDGMPLPARTPSGLSPNFDKAANERSRAANAAYARYAATYRNPIVGPGLRTTGYSGAYQRSDAGFIKGAIRPGPEGYENARAHLVAAANDPVAVGAMHEAVLNPLRKATLGNGMISSKALAAWKDNFGPALRALDEVSPGFSSRFDSAAKAEQALTDLGVRRKREVDAAQAEAAAQALTESQSRKAGLKADDAADKASTGAGIDARTAADRAADARSKADMRAGVDQARGVAKAAAATPAGRFAKAARDAISPAEVGNAVGSMLSTGTGGVRRMRGLVQSVANDPEALAGLRKAGSDWIAQEHIGDDGRLDGAKMIGFLKENVDVLRELFPHAQVSMMGAVARHAMAGGAWETAAAAKGRGLSKAGEALKHLSLGAAAIEALSRGYEHGGPKGAAAAGAVAATAYLVNTLRHGGIERVSDLYHEMLASPELARAMISKMPDQPDATALHNVARIVRRSLIVAPIATREDGAAAR